ncbi:MAG: HNH endonuclease signature motif containing protein [Burkholderiaceae bacterium]|nr:HNH endonuclease signature motif containing protein [Burkholderiaceae bacterium]
MLAKTAGRCHVCGGPIEGLNWHADHVLAHSGGGAHSVDNYLAAHPICNNYRWDYLDEEFREILRLGVWLRNADRGVRVGLWVEQRPMP